MPNIFTLLNNSDFYRLSDIKQLFDKENSNPNSEFQNVMIKALFGTTHNILTIDDVSIICDGNIYNYSKIYKDLQIIPKTEYDYEVIIHLYKIYGIETTLQVLDGIYAFILIDNRITNSKDLDAKIYIARDPYGVKPLYILKPNTIHPNYSLIKSKLNNIYGFSSQEQVLNHLQQDLIFSNQDIIYGNNYAKSFTDNEDDISNLKSFYNTELILPGTYSAFKLKYKVLSLWENVCYQIPFHSLIPGTVLNNDFLSESLTQDILLTYMRNAYLKRMEYYNKDILVISDKSFRELETNSVFNILKTKTIKNKINHYLINNGQEDGYVDWEVIPKEISEKYPGRIIFINVGLYDLIKSKKDMGELEFRNYAQEYFKNIYNNKIKDISKEFYKRSIIIDFPLLDINFIQYFLTNCGKDYNSFLSC